MTPEECEGPMSLLVIVLPMGGLLALIALGSFVWAIRSGQLDDLGSPRLRMLLDAGRDEENDEKGDTGRGRPGKSSKHRAPGDRTDRPR